MISGKPHTTIKITLVDDHPVVVKGLQMILQEFKHITLIDACHSAQGLLECLAVRQPDVLLLDIQLPDKQGDEIAQIVAKKYPHIAMLVLTNLDQTFHLKNMLLHGVKGYLLKNAPPSALLQAIETVYHGEQFIDPHMKEYMLQEYVGADKDWNIIPALTLREQEVLKLIADEHTSQEIAEKLFVSNRTIETHRLNLLLKFGVKNVAGLIRKAIQLKILK